MATPKWKSPFELLAIGIYVLIFGSAAIIKFLVDLVLKGPRRMFYYKKRIVRPQVLSDNRFGSHEFVMLKNSRMKLHCVVNGPKDKPLMLFLHGFPEFWYSWRFQLKEFCKDYRVVAIDMRGYGESDKPRPVSSYHMDQLTSDVNQLIVALGYEKCFLVSHDWGGAVAWMFAYQYPEMVEKLIVCNSPHPAAFGELLKTSWAQTFKSWYMFFFQLPVFPIVILQSNDIEWVSDVFCGQAMGAKPGSFTDEDIEAYKYTLYNYDDLLGPINYYRARFRYAKIDTSLVKIKPPVMVIWGTKDGALSKELPELAAKYIENYTLKWVEGASHWVQQEEPDVVNGHIREFLKS